jgi:flagellin-like protein
MIDAIASDDERGVSPVIGVILMVAITVLLAATAGTLFLSFQNENQSANPSVAFEFDYEVTGSGDQLAIQHVSGDTVEAGNLEIVISGAGPSDANGRYEFQQFSAFGGPESSISAGTSLLISKSELGASSSLDLSEATVRLVWSDGGDSSTTLQEWSGD